MNLWLKISVTIYVLFAHWMKLTEQKALDDYILDYQEVNYDPFDLHERHLRVKRSLDTDLYLSFTAYNRDFHLKLQTANDIFSVNHMTVNEDGDLEPVDTSFIYEGSLVDVPESFIHMAILNGTLQGHIHVPDDTTYHVEPSKRFFLNPRFHSVIYSEKHMNFDPYRHLRENKSNAGHCGNDHAKKWMDNLSKSVFKIPNRDKRSETGSEDGDSVKYSENGDRDKRTTYNPKKNTCFLYLRSDPTLWNYIKKKKYKRSKSDPDLSDERVKEEIQAFFASNVASSKTIYSNTRFQTYDNLTAYKGITFLVQRTKIMTDKSEYCGTTMASPYCRTDMDDSNFLNINSMDNHDDFCLAFLFGYRDFSGVLGLAWVGSTGGSSGICGKHMRRHYKSKQGVSYNTGIVTILNHGHIIPPRVSQITFAHEVGHTFGSPHDDGVDCVPYGTKKPGAEFGNYIMFRSATMGDMKHNDMFSSCSKDNITRVLYAVFHGKRGRVNCFGEKQGAFCGNGIREIGEECDCGYKDACTDRCCYPKNSPHGECKLATILNSRVQCSPTQGPCCHKTCLYVSKAENHICRPDDDCSHEQHCNGNSSVCLPSRAKPDLTLCHSNSQVCIAGKCSGSVCESIGWSECFLTSTDNKDGPSKDELCYVSCLNKQTKKCVSSSNLDRVNRPENKPFKDLLTKISNSSTNIKGIKLPSGSPCDNFKGYCDVFQLCRIVDADGPLARLKNYILNPKTVKTIKKWFTVYWWAVILMFIGLGLGMAGFVHYCAIHTPSSNPRLPPAKRYSLPKLHSSEPAPDSPTRQ